MDLYHVDIRLPDGFRLPARIVGLEWGFHALNACRDDRYGYIEKVTEVDLTSMSVIEVGVTGKKVEKIVVRGSLDNERDIVYVLIPKGYQPWFVKTVWINERNDTHKTLDRSRYVC